MLSNSAILNIKICQSTSHACHVFLSDGDTLPLSQPQSAHGTLVGGSSCPGTPEMRRRQEEALRRLASQVPTNTNIINRARHMTSLPFNLPLFFSSIDLLSLCVPVSAFVFIKLLLLSLFLFLFLYSFKHKGLLRLCCLIKYLYAQSLPAQPLDILRALHC